MKTLVPLAAAFLLAGTVAAQVTAKQTTATDVTTSATCGDNNKDNDKVDKGKTFTRRWGVSSSQRYCTYASSGGSMGSYRNRRTGKRTTYSRFSNSTSYYGRSSSSKGTAACGSHGVDMVLSADSDTKGKLTIWVGGGASTGQKASASAKVGTKTVSWKAGDKTQKLEMDVTIGKSGLTISTTSDASVDGKGRTRAKASSFISAYFVADDSSGGKCDIKDGVASCGGKLAGTASTSRFGHLITLKLTGDWKNTFGLSFFSASANTVKIGNCVLLATPTALGVFTTDDNGAATHRLRVPANKDMKFSLQDLTFRITTKFEWQTSNTLDVSCTKG